MARVAILVLCTLGASATAARAQTSDSARALDSLSLFSRAQQIRFNQMLATFRPVWSEIAPWDIPSHPSTASGILGAFDSTVRRGSADRDELVAQQHLVRKVLGRFGSDTTLLADRGAFGLSRNTADITFDGQLEFDLSSSRQQNLSCTPAAAQVAANGCYGKFTTPNIDNIITLQSQGVFLQRFHVNISFDSKADFAANNIVSVRYLGLEDEKLQSVDIGTVQLLTPPTRFLAASVPANNFGIRAQMAFGPVQLQVIAATQKGSKTNTKTFQIGSTVVAPQDNLVRDIDYEQGLAFWTVDPATLPGYPALDILNAAAIAVSAAQRPVDVNIYRYEAANLSAGANANYDGITARASNGPSEQVGALRWHLLRRNVDYWLDPSGLWFVLAQKNSPSNFLAVSYKTASGAVVGTFPTVDNPANNDSLKLIYLPNRPQASTLFNYSMRQIYHVAGASLVKSSLVAQILVANSERPDSGLGTFLSLLGMAVPQNQLALDVDNRLFPRIRDAGAALVLSNAYLVFPSTQPFSNPGLRPNQRNDSLYRTPEYLLFSQGPPSVFKLHLQYSATSGSDNGSVSLDALQIAEGSDVVEVNGRTLVRNTDYTIDYALGRIAFVNPALLFGGSPASVTVQYEQRDLFAIAPTSLAGVTATWTIGSRKTLSFIGLYQSEETPYTRPQIGNEPRSSLLAGFTGDFYWNTPGLTRFLNKITKVHSTARSSVELTGELATSRPNDNRSGDAYLEEFENDHSLPIPAAVNAWLYGSVPKSTAGLTDILPFGFDTAQAVQLTWQNAIEGTNDSLVQVTTAQIDPTVVQTASATPTFESVLWTTLHADTAGGIVDSTGASHWKFPARPGTPRWRSITTALSATGQDLSNNDFLEFALYQRSDQPIQQSKTRIVVDLGRVSEDELSIAPTNFTVNGRDTTFTGRQYVGLGRLNSERTQFGTWSEELDNGILADRPDTLIGPDGHAVLNLPLCTANVTSTILIYPWGDLGSNCTNKNSLPDTEDLDGDNVLDAQGPNDNVFRYVVDLSADSAKYFVRSHVILGPDSLPAHDSRGRSASWTIYRVPLRIADDTIGTPDIHLIKQMRVTLVAPATSNDSVIRFALARMRFTGAPWIARAGHPVLTLSGVTGQPVGTVTVGTISTQDSAQLGYTSPPGVTDAAATVTVSQSQASTQINEKSLRIQTTGLLPGERAEGYERLLSSQNLLAYRTLRIWLRGGVNTPGWNDGRLQAYIKVGSDAFNFYLYRTAVTTTSWDPEVLIDLQTWRDLREIVENERLHLLPPSQSDWKKCGGDSTAYVACDGNYMVQVRDPLVNPPNLASVQELSGGIYYAAAIGLPIDHTELWIDDIRVSDPVSTPGYAAAFTAHVDGSDLFTFDLNGLYEDGNFHTMSALPTYLNSATVSAATTVRLEKFLSPRLGLVIPVTVTNSWGWTDPTLLAGTDVEAGGISGLRHPQSYASSWSISMRHLARVGESSTMRFIADPLSFSAAGGAFSSTTSLTDADADNWNGTLAYTLVTLPRWHSFHLKSLAAKLPAWFQQSAAGKAFATGGFNWIPSVVQLSSSLSHTMGQQLSYTEPITQLSDTILKPVTSEQFQFHNSAGVTWRPLGMLSVASGWASTRDLRTYSDSTTLGRVVDASHRTLLGADLGVESDRNVFNNITLTPRINTWLNPIVTLGTNFSLSRSTASRNPIRIDGDTAGAYILPQTLNNARSLDTHLVLDPHALMQRIFGDSSKVAKALIRFRPIDFDRQTTITSTFDLAAFNPTLGYQFALGGLNSFLMRNGESAVGAATGTTLSVTASMILPLGFSGDMQFRSTTSDRYDRNPGAGFLQTTGTTTSWPSGSISWTRVLPGSFLSSFTVSSGIHRDVASSLSPFSDGTFVTSTSSQSRVNPNVLLLFRNGVNLTMTGEIDRASALTGGNITQTDMVSLSPQVSWSLRMPTFISSTRRQMTTRVGMIVNNSSSCVQRSSDSICIPSYDLKRIEFDASLSASLQHGISAGFGGSYIYNTVTSSGLKSSTITLTTFVRLPLSGLGI